MFQILIFVLWFYWFRSAACSSLSFNYSLFKKKSIQGWNDGESVDFVFVIADVDLSFQ